MLLEDKAPELSLLIISLPVCSPSLSNRTAFPLHAVWHYFQHVMLKELLYSFFSINKVSGANKDMDAFRAPDGRYRIFYERRFRRGVILFFSTLLAAGEVLIRRARSTHTHRGVYFLRKRARTCLCSAAFGLLLFLTPNVNRFLYLLCVKRARQRVDVWCSRSWRKWKAAERGRFTWLLRAARASVKPHKQTASLWAEISAKSMTSFYLAASSIFIICTLQKSCYSSTFHFSNSQNGTQIIILMIRLHILEQNFEAQIWLFANQKGTFLFVFNVVML